MSATYFKSMHVDEDPQGPPKFFSDVRLSGADQLLARDPETVAFLAKCYAEKVTHPPGQRWPIFAEKRLGAFLAALGVDLEEAKKFVGEPTDVPTYCDSMEQSVKMFNGASFLAKNVYEVCAHLRSRRALART